MALILVLLAVAYYEYRIRVGAVPVYSYRVVKTYPHDPQAYTQGLVYHDGVLYESTGLRGESSVRRLDLDTGKVLQIHELNERFFGEAIALVGDKLVQLTWQAHVGFVYDRRDFRILRTFTYPGQGWGLTYDGRRLIMSDGTAMLTFLDPAQYRIVGRVRVRAKSKPVANLNELEYIKGRIYANIWHSERVAIIVPETGQVEAWVNLHGLLSPGDRRRSVDVLNGIAYDERTGHLLVTGKRWPKLFEVALLK